MDVGTPPFRRKIHPHSAGQFSLTEARACLSFSLLRPSSRHEGCSLGTPSQAQLLEDVADVAFDTVLTEGEQRKGLVFSENQDTYNHDPIYFKGRYSLRG